jgi:RNA-binding protein Musashi
MRDAAGRSRCFAFLTFDDPASVNAVMVREHILDGKIVGFLSIQRPIINAEHSVQIDPKRAIPRQEHQRATKLFIGGLPGSVTSESMREFFSQFGKVIDSTVMLDRETGRSKGFGFVSFENTDVTPFLGFGNLEIDGKLASLTPSIVNVSTEPFSFHRLTSSLLNHGINVTINSTKTELSRSKPAVAPAPVTSKVKPASITNKAATSTPTWEAQTPVVEEQLKHLSILKH